MSLLPLIKTLPNSQAPDRALYGDQYDLKIDNEHANIVAIATAIDAGTGVTFPNQVPNVVFAGPPTGLESGPPSFRFLATADLPLIKSTNLNLFVSTEQTGTGSSQSIAHTLGHAPTFVVVSFTSIPAGGADVTEGSHTGTNIVVTATSMSKFKVWAMV